MLWHLEGRLALVVGELGGLPVLGLRRLGALLLLADGALTDLLVHGLVQVLEVIALKVCLQVGREVLLVLLRVLLLQ